MLAPYDALVPLLDERFHCLQIALWGRLPFVISCDQLLWDHKDKTHGFRWAKSITRIGLGYLIATITFFLGLSQYVPDTTTSTNTTNAITAPIMKATNTTDSMSNGSTTATELTRGQSNYNQTTKVN